jgi:hypothetical protein
MSKLQNNKDLARLGTWIKEVTKSDDFVALYFLRNAIKDALLSQKLKQSPIVTEVAEKFIEIIESCPISLKRADLDRIFQPATNAAVKKIISARASKAGSAPKKATKQDALKCWEAWISNDSKYKNKTQFCKKIVDEKYCSTEKTAGKWVDEFRNTHPSPNLEKILPKKN